MACFANATVTYLAEKRLRKRKRKKSQQEFFKLFVRYDGNP